MIKTKKQNIFQIFFNGLKIYLKNFIPLTKGMIFPVFGQLVGIILVLSAAYFYTTNYVNTITPSITNVLLVFLGLIILTLPGFVIFAKAFWDYMLVMVSLNNLAENIIINGKLRDIRVHNQSVSLRSKEYVILLLMLTLLWLLAMVLPFLVFIFSSLNSMIIMLSFIILETISIFMATLISIYLSLSFQIFAFEDISPIKVIKRSWELIEGNFWRTIILCVILFFTTNTIIPTIGRLFYENDFIINNFSVPVQKYLALLLNNQEITAAITDKMIQLNLLPANQTIIEFLSKNITLLTIDVVLIAMLLPLGSVCYTILYRDIIYRREKIVKKNKKS